MSTSYKQKTTTLAPYRALTVKFLFFSSPPTVNNKLRKCSGFFHIIQI